MRFEDETGPTMVCKRCNTPIDEEDHVALDGYCHGCFLGIEIKKKKAAGAKKR